MQNSHFLKNIVVGTLNIHFINPDSRGPFTCLLELNWATLSLSDLSTCEEKSKWRVSLVIKTFGTFKNVWHTSPVVWWEDCRMKCVSLLQYWDSPLVLAGWQGLVVLCGWLLLFTHTALCRKGLVGFSEACWVHVVSKMFCYEAGRQMEVRMLWFYQTNNS